MVVICKTLETNLFEKLYRTVFFFKADVVDWSFEFSVTKKCLVKNNTILVISNVICQFPICIQQTLISEKAVTCEVLRTL